MGLNRFASPLVLGIALVTSACSLVAPDEQAVPSSVAFEAPTSTELAAESSTTAELTTTTTEPTTTTTEPTTTTTVCVAPDTTILYAVSGVPEKLNVRSGAGTSNAVVSGFSNGHRGLAFTAACTKIGNIAWWQLQSGEGWLASPYVKPQGNSVCTSGSFDSTGVSNLSANTGEIDGDGRIDTVYTFVRNGELTVAAELGDGGYIETVYAEDQESGFVYGYPTDLSNIRAVRPAGLSGDILFADSSNNQFYMFGYRLCEIPMIGGSETDGPFSFVKLRTPELSQRIVCAIDPTGTNLYMHRWGTDIDGAGSGGEELRQIVFDANYHGASTASPIAPDPNTGYFDC